MAVKVATELKPLADRVVLKPDEEQAQKSPGGIFIPDTAKEKPQQGTVVAAGPGRVSDEGKLVPMTVAVGDKVIYSKYSGTEYTHDGVEYLIVRESDILAKIS